MDQTCDPTPHTLERGWGLLSDGRWEQARACFAELVGESADPEAFEGLSWAAWWLDDRSEVFAARRRAFEEYERAGSAAAAARMATWLAADELDFNGADAVARGWLQRARRLLEPLEPGPEHGWLSFQTGYMEKDFRRMRAEALKAAEIGRRFGIADLQMLGLALEGSALVAEAEVDQGMRRLDEAAVLALDRKAAIPISQAWCFCFLVSACTAVLDFERAKEWCARIAEFAEEYGSQFMLGFCRAEYGEIFLWDGQWDRASSMLESSIESFSTSRPAWVDAPVRQLAELRRRQGKAADARVLLNRVATPQAHLCKAQMAMDSGDHALAAELADRVLRQQPKAHLSSTAPAADLKLRACLATGDRQGAAQALSFLMETRGTVAAPPVEALIERSEALVAMADGEHDRARRLLEDSLDGLYRCGAAYEGARTGVDLATCLLEMGRRDGARREAVSALSKLEHMGAAVEAARAKAVLDECAPSGSGRLTPREREVLRLICEGGTNREIASRLVISEHTVHRHVTNILRKLDLPSRAAAAAWAAKLKDPST